MLGALRSYSEEGWYVYALRGGKGRGREEEEEEEEACQDRARLEIFSMANIWGGGREHNANSTKRLLLQVV